MATMRLLMITGALCACTGPERRAPAPGSTEQSISSGPAPFEHRTALHITASGEFKPRQPVMISLEVRGHRASQRTRLRMSVTPTSGAQIREHVLLARTLAIPEGTIIRESPSYVFGEPGYYLITATSHTEVIDEPRKDSARVWPLANENAAQVWILIAPNGGRLDRVFSEPRTAR